MRIDGKVSVLTEPGTTRRPAEPAPPALVGKTETACITLSLSEKNTPVKIIIASRHPMRSSATMWLTSLILRALKSVRKLMMMLKIITLKTGTVRRGMLDKPGW